jgi:hypothetical protein
MYLIPLFGALIGWLTVKVILWLTINRIIPNNQKLIQQEIINLILNDWNPEAIITEKVKQINLESDIGPILDKKLDSFIENLGSKIPFGQVVLAGPFVNKMKEKVKREILQSLPELQDNLANKVKTKFNIRALIEEKVLSFNLKEVAQSLFKSSLKRRQLEGLGALIGFSLSLIQFVFFISLGY